MKSRKSKLTKSIGCRRRRALTLPARPENAKLFIKIHAALRSRYRRNSGHLRLPSHSGGGSTGHGAALAASPAPSSTCPPGWGHHAGVSSAWRARCCGPAEAGLLDRVGRPDASASRGDLLGREAGRRCARAGDRRCGRARARVRAWCAEGEPTCDRALLFQRLKRPNRVWTRAGPPHPRPTRCCPRGHPRRGCDEARIDAPPLEPRALTHTRVPVLHLPEAAGIDSIERNGLRASEGCSSRRTVRSSRR